MVFIWLLTPGTSNPDTNKSNKCIEQPNIIICLFCRPSHVARFFFYLFILATLSIITLSTVQPDST